MRPPSRPAFELALQRGKAVAPEAVEHLQNLCHTIGARAVQPAVAFYAHADEIRLPQDLQVLGCGWFRQPTANREIARAPFDVGNELKHASAPRMSQRP
jgi:hypothetical protein